MRTRVREQRVLVSLTRLEAEVLHSIIADFIDLTEYAPTDERTAASLARRLRNALVDRISEVHDFQKSLSIARGSDRRNA